MRTVLALILSCLLLAGCKDNHTVSKIQFYGGDGRLLREWSAVGTVITIDGVFRFNDISTGRQVKCVGNIIVEKVGWTNIPLNNR
jgi:hypothetical protein